MPHDTPAAPLLAELDRFLASLEPGITAMPADRATQIDAIAADLRVLLSGARSPDSELTVLFVCTHNSRRSHIAHLLFAAAAGRAGLRLASQSAGTEVTAFHPNAIAALRRCGYRIEPVPQGTPGAEQPAMHARASDDAEPIRCWSKTVLDESLNDRRLAAIMVCSHADRSCPPVPGAAARHALPFDDPKAGDGQPDQDDRYDASAREIGTAMVALVNRLRSV